MRPRKLPLETPPDRWPWVRVRVQGAGPFVLRSPSLGRLQKLLPTWQRAIEGNDIAGMEDAGARILGEAWADPTLELEHDAHDGAAVWEELHEAGWSLAVVAAIVSGLIERAGRGAPTESEVAGLVDFSDAGAKTAPTASSSLTDSAVMHSAGTP